LDLSDFQYDLPEELIAQHPLDRRDASRMLVLDRASGRIEHAAFSLLPDLLSGSELILYNDTKVIPARVYFRKPTGGLVEALAVRFPSANSFEAMTRSSKPLKLGQTLSAASGQWAVTVAALPEPGRAVFETPRELPALELLHAEGVTPLPPYIRRETHLDSAADRDRYQTIFAREPGSVAAPTAGLHFTPEVKARLERKGCTLAALTLHVGPGTFQPVRTQVVEEHRMEREHYFIPEETAAAVNAAQADGRPILAVGTTTVRSLETAAAGGRVRAGSGWSELFITPGFRFQVVGRLLTNFHLPGSTLLMLVSALAGRERVLAAYAEAVALRYRFYSYGDCMLIV
jgi:S-adenosylmethionine:tRNA ribosyltransferase-isomerase